MKKPITLSDDHSYPLHFGGSISTLPQQEEEEDEVIAALHQAVKDVTGKEVERKEKPRIGFLP